MKLFFTDHSKYLLLILTLINQSILAEKSDTNSPKNGENTPKIQLLGDKLNKALSAKDFALAQSLLNDAKKVPNLDPIANFHLAKLAASQNNSEKLQNHLKALRNSSLIRNTALMSEIYFRARSEDRSRAAKTLAELGIIEAKRLMPCPFFELDARIERGSLLADMVNTKGLSKDQENMVWQELYLDLAEVVSEGDLKKHPKFAAWQKALKPRDYIERINKLTLFGKNKEAKDTYDLAILSFSNLSKTERCALDYEAAKLLRLARKYQDARKQFQSLAQRCDNDIKLKARYKDLQLAAMTSDKKSLQQCDLFVRDYPTHGFSDDVLMFKTLIYLDHSQNASAKETLDQLIDKFPDGDMIYRALFKKAMLFAKEEQIEKALSLLKKLKQKAAPASLTEAQALYWLNRLKIFPKLNSINIPTKKQSLEANAELKSLFQSNSPTIYSWLAGILLAELKELPTPIPIQKNIETQTSQYKKPSLLMIKSLIENGFNKEALALLSEEPVSSKDKNAIGAIAELYIATGQPSAGHQKLIRCNEIMANTLKKHWPNYYNQISWAKPFKNEVSEVASQLNIPTNLIYGIMRQESGFLSTACSWAEARGLMQLMESTANEQAKKLELKKIKAEDLFDTKLNILLGSNVIKDYWQQFGNLAIALSAYNAGPGPAAKWQKNFAGQPVDTFIENIPYRDTYAYVRDVLGSLYAYSSLDGHIKEVLDAEANLAHCYLHCRAEH